MKNFFSTFFACLLAIFASCVLVSLVSFIIFAAIIASVSVGSSGAGKIEKGSVLLIELNEDIYDSPSNKLLKQFNPLTLSIKHGLYLSEIINAIEAAQNDENIEGILLKINPDANIGMATAEEIRNAIVKFGDGGKFVISYSDNYSQLSYYISSAASKLYLNPVGETQWKGLASQVIFLKGTLDKLGVKAEIVRCGEYKSAVEPFIYDRMSPENRAQTQILVNSIWGDIVEKIAGSRGLDSLTITEYADKLSVSGAKSSVNSNMADGALYYDEIEDMICQMTGGDDPKLVPLYGYISSLRMRIAHTSYNKVAVIYADGEIIEGESGDGMVGSATISRQLAKARKDDEVKAVVLRINSPGGSAIASEVICRELSLVKEEKPVIVSMGDYAASGGYYIATPADIIIADKSTITGSIGVFGIMFDASEALEDKLGITTEVVKTNPSADMMTPFRAQTKHEKEYLQRTVDDIYKTFVSRVAEGRNLDEDVVLKIAGGRVWSGIDAHRIGLLDGFGGLNDAIAFAAARAGVTDNFSIKVYSGYDNYIQEMLSGFLASKISLSNKKIDKLIEEYENLARIVERAPVQAAMPYRMVLK